MKAEHDEPKEIAELRKMVFAEPENYQTYTTTRISEEEAYGSDCRSGSC